jgi:hypothetical protein
MYMYRKFYFGFSTKHLDYSLQYPRDCLKMSCIDTCLANEYEQGTLRDAINPIINRKEMAASINLTMAKNNNNCSVGRVGVLHTRTCLLLLL